MTEPTKRNWKSSHHPVDNSVEPHAIIIAAKEKQTEAKAKSIHLANSTNEEDFGPDKETNSTKFSPSHKGKKAKIEASTTNNENNLISSLLKEEKKQSQADTPIADCYDWYDFYGDPADIDPMEDFHDSLVSIKLNCCRVTEFRTYLLTTQTAFSLGEALFGNTHLKMLGINLDSSTNIVSIRMLVGGIKASSVNKLCIAFNGDIHPPKEGLEILFSSVATTVNEIVLANPLSHVDAIALSESLLKVGPSTLRSLSFEHCFLSTDDAKLLAQGLRASSIKELKLFGDTPVDTNNVLCTLYDEGIPKSSIENISLDGCIGKMHGLAAVLHCFCYLAVKDVILTTNDTNILRASLLQPNSIHHLELVKCGLDDSRMNILSTCFRDNRVMKTLILSQNSIGDPGIMSFASNWTTSSILDRIDLYGNDIGHNGAQCLLQLSSKRPSLKHLNLSYNRQIDFTGIRLVAQELPNNAFLKELLLEQVTQNWRSSRSETMEIKASINAAVTSVLNGLRNNMNLHVLTMDDTVFRRLDTANRMAFYLHLNKDCNRSQLLREPSLPSSYWCFILKKFCLNPSVVFSFLIEMPHLIPSR
jgi:Leucine Rich repeat